MKKLLFVLLIFAVAGASAYAFDPMAYSLPVKGGDILVDAGVGFAFASHGGALKIPPIWASAEYALSAGVPVSVGAFASFYRYGYDYSGFGYSWAETWTYITFGARGNWHWNLPVEKLDLYTGLFLGYSIFSFDWDYTGSYNYAKPNYGGLAFGGQLGAHYYFTKNIGAVLELGYPFVKAGVALKF